MTRYLISLLCRWYWTPKGAVGWESRLHMRTTCLEDTTEIGNRFARRYHGTLYNHSASGFDWLQTTFAFLFCSCLTYQYRLQSGVTDILVVQGDFITLYFDTRPAVITMVSIGFGFLCVCLLSAVVSLTGANSLNIFLFNAASVAIACLSSTVAMYFLANALTHQRCQGAVGAQWGSGYGTTCAGHGSDDPQVGDAFGILLHRF